MQRSVDAHAIIKFISLDTIDGALKAAEHTNHNVNGYISSYLDHTEVLQFVAEFSSDDGIPQTFSYLNRKRL